MVRALQLYDFTRGPACTAWKEPHQAIITTITEPCIFGLRDLSPSSHSV